MWPAGRYKNGLEPPLAFGVAHSHITAFHGRPPRHTSQGGAREDPQGVALAPVPVHFHGLPWGIGALCPALQAALAFSFQRFATTLAWGLRRRPMIERRIPPQARDHRHTALDTRQGQRHRGKAAIDDQHQPPARQSAAHLVDHLSDPIDAGFMPSSRGLLRGPTQSGEKGQRPDPPAPRHWDQ